MTRGHAPSQVGTGGTMVPVPFFFMSRPPPSSTLFPYTTLFRSFPDRFHGYFMVNPLEDTAADRVGIRSEEHTSELQSHVNLVCRLLLEKKKSNPDTRIGLWSEADFLLAMHDGVHRAGRSSSPSF